MAKSSAKKQRAKPVPNTIATCSQNYVKNSVGRSCVKKCILPSTRHAKGYCSRCDKGKRFSVKHKECRTTHTREQRSEMALAKKKTAAPKKKASASKKKASASKKKAATPSKTQKKIAKKVVASAIKAKRDLQSVAKATGSESAKKDIAQKLKQIDQKVAVVAKVLRSGTRSQTKAAAAGN